jgi:hypothetical protein
MNITAAANITAFADVTPADALASQIYRLGFSGATMTIPSSADLVVTRAIVCANGSAKVLEPDTNTLDGEGTPPKNPDGETVALATVYALVIQNSDAALSATYSSANFGSVTVAGTLQPGAICVHHFPAGLAIGASTTLSLTGLSGTPTVNVLMIGAE